jgi:hypothetical protein
VVTKLFNSAVSTVELLIHRMMHCEIPKSGYDLSEGVVNGVDLEGLRRITQ